MNKKRKKKIEMLKIDVKNMAKSGFKKIKKFRKIEKMVNTVLDKAKKEGLDDLWTDYVFNQISTHFSQFVLTEKTLKGKVSFKCGKCLNFKSGICEGGRKFPNCFLKKAKNIAREVESLKHKKIERGEKFADIVFNEAIKERLNKEWIECIFKLIFIHFYFTGNGKIPSECKKCLNFKSDICKGGKFPNCFIKKMKIAKQQGFEPSILTHWAEKEMGIKISE